MTGERDPKNCGEFQAQLPDLIGSGVDAKVHPHLKSCDLCRALLAELETIAEAARQLFPEVEPPDEVWEHIESAIQKSAETNSGGSGLKNNSGPGMATHPGT
jgi:hypothetical protein